MFGLVLSSSPIRVLPMQAYTPSRLGVVIAHYQREKKG